MAQVEGDAAVARLEAMERNAPLIRELAGMGALDQAVRVTFLDARRHASDTDRAALEAAIAPVIERLDQQHRQRLEAILNDHEGWFPISTYGERAAMAAYQIVQHSGDPALQHDALSRMEPLFGTDDLEPSQYARLYDRWSLATGGQQRYGTQGTACVDGRFATPTDIEDPDGLAARRAQAGLEPIGTYLQGLDQLYGRCVP